MKEIEIFTESEKDIMRPLLIAAEHGDHEAAIKFMKMKIHGYKRTIAEYKKHPENEEVISDEYNLFPADVKSAIAELEEAIAETRLIMNKDE